jgi:hypothetical protein
MPCLSEPRRGIEDPPDDLGTVPPDLLQVALGWQ